MFLMLFERNHIFDGKMGMAALVAPRGLGPLDSTKKLAHQVDLLGQPLSRKNVFEIFGPEPPSPNKLIYFIRKNPIYRGTKLWKWKNP